MAYRKKEDWLNEAARLGIDVDGLSWPQLQKTVSQALKREELGISTDYAKPADGHRSRDLSDMEAHLYIYDDLGVSQRWANKFSEAGIEKVADLVGYTEDDLRRIDGIGAKAIEELKRGLEEYNLAHVIEDNNVQVFDIAEQKPKPKKKRKRMMTMAELDEQRLRQFTGQEIMIAPEIYPSTKRAIHYKEDIGPEILVDEKHYDIRGLEFNTGRDVDSGTYVIKGKTGERVVATSAIPKEEPGLKINPGQDYVPRVTYMGREGYLWTHHSYPNIRELLEQSGYYEEYKHLFKDEPNIWYSAGLLVCEPSVVHNVFREIEEKERLKKERGY